MRFIIEPDYNSPNIFYIFDTLGGKKAIALFYNARVAGEFLIWINDQAKLDNKYAV